MQIHKIYKLENKMNRKKLYKKKITNQEKYQIWKKYYKKKQNRII